MMTIFAGARSRFFAAGLVFGWDYTDLPFCAIRRYRRSRFSHAKNMEIKLDQDGRVRYRDVTKRDALIGCVRQGECVELPFKGLARNLHIRFKGDDLG